jgi:hypothetical protein
MDLLWIPARLQNSTCAIGLLGSFNFPDRK